MILRPACIDFDAMSATKILWGQVFAVFLIVLAALSFDVLAGLTNCRTLSTDAMLFWLLFVGIASSVSIGAPVGSAPPTPARP